MNAEINKDFIFNYFSGKTSALQKQMVDEWVKKPANEAVFYQWLMEFEYQHPQYIADVPKAISHFQSFADQFDENPTSLPYKNRFQSPVRRPLWAWLVAASLLTGLLLGGWVFRNNFIYQTYTTSFGETESLILSDQTQVTLNANSSLRVPRFGFGIKTREVFLAGEAQFSVTHQSNNQRFLVKTNNGLDVIVWGTKFTVFARQRGAKVVLNEGKVELRYHEGKKRKQLMMKPGDLVSFDQTNKPKQEVTKQPEKYTAWTEHRFVFDDTTLEEFAHIMEENYGIEVIIDDKNLAQRTLVGSFRADNADELLEIVTEIFDVKMKKQDKKVWLSVERNKADGV